MILHLQHISSLWLMGTEMNVCLEVVVLVEVVQVAVLVLVEAIEVEVVEVVKLVEEIPR